MTSALSDPHAAVAPQADAPTRAAGVASAAPKAAPKSHTRAAPEVGRGADAAVTRGCSYEMARGVVWICATGRVTTNGALTDTPPPVRTARALSDAHFVAQAAVWPTRTRSEASHDPNAAPKTVTHPPNVAGGGVD
jgi:hypothetical protein